MSVQEHYSISPIINKYPDALYYLIFGEKSNGKSYQAKQNKDCAFGVTHYLKTKKKFILLRRWGADLTTSWIEKYFSDVDVEKLTDGKYTCITTWRKDLFFSNIDENYKIKRGEKIGTCIVLSQEQHFSGASFLDYDNIIFEEFMERGAYLAHESEKLQILYSTVDRKRGSTKVVMVGNTISRVCPYLVDWNLLEDMRKLKQGQMTEIDTGTEYELENGEIKKVTIAIEYCRSSGGKTLAFGSAKTMIDSGSWQSRPQPKLSESKKNYKVLFRFGFQYQGFKFLSELLEHKDTKEICFFIYPYKKEFSNNLIVFSDIVKLSKYWQRDIYNISINNKKLQNIFMQFQENKIFYSDDLTGTDFKQCIDFTIRR